MSWPLQIASHAVLSLGSDSRVWSTTANCTVWPIVILPASGFSLPVIMRNSVVLPAPFGPMTPTIAPAGMRNERSSIRSLSPYALRTFSNSITASPSRSATGMKISLRLVALLVLVGGEVVEARDARLALRLPALGVLAHPLELVLHRLDARRLLLRLGFEALLLLLEPRAVVAFPRNAVAAIELEDPFRGVVEEVAVVRHRDHGARKFRTGTAPANPRSPRRGGWSARRAAACRASTAAAGTAPRAASRRPIDWRSSRPRAAAAARRRRFPFARRSRRRRWR